MIAFETTFELILCQMLSSQGKNAPSDPYPHYLVRLAASRYGFEGLFSWRFLADPEMHLTRPMTGRLPTSTPLAGVNCTWVKPGRFGSFFVLYFLALGGHCLQMLCLPGFGTHANTQNLPHFRAFPASIWEHSPPKCLFCMANAKLPNRPVFALLSTVVKLWKFSREILKTPPFLSPAFPGGSRNPKQETRKGTEIHGP